LLRLSGVLASGSPWRAAVVANGPAATGGPVPETTKAKTNATAPLPSAAQGAPASARTSLGDGIVLPVSRHMDRVVERLAPRA
jgi:hypothetical protein